MRQIITAPMMIRLAVKVRGDTTDGQMFCFDNNGGRLKNEGIPRPKSAMIPNRRSHRMQVPARHRRALGCSSAIVRENGILKQMIRRASPVALLMRKALEKRPAKLHEKKNREGTEKPKRCEMDAQRRAAKS